MADWQDDEVILQADRGEKSTYNEMVNGDDEQLGGGWKRSHDEIDDDDDTILDRSDEGFIMESMKQLMSRNSKQQG